MLNTNKVFAILISLLIIGCAKDTEEYFEKADFQLEIINDSLDVNNDGINDFKIFEYELETDDIPSTSGTLSKNLYSIQAQPGYNFYFYNRSRTLKPSAQLVERNMFVEQANKSWLESCIIYKDRFYSNYDEFWTPGHLSKPDSNNTVNEQYNAFKIFTPNNEILIGWIQFKVDLKSGNIKVGDFDYTNKESIIISK